MGTPQRDDVDITGQFNSVMPQPKWTTGLALIKSRNEAHSESRN